ncbi:unnamed protein product [Lathyrus oleraceus]
MDPKEQNQTMSRDDIDVMRNQLNQLIEVMVALANREDNIQRTVVTENVIPPQVNNRAQPQPVRIPFENPAIQEHHIIQDGHSSPHDAIKYHSFAFSEPNDQGAILVRKTKRPEVIEIVEKYHVLNERLEAIEGHDYYDLDTLNMF